MRYFPLVYFLLFIICWPLAASNKYYNFQAIPLKNGISSNVNCIYTGRNGLVWIGTRHGVVRFDGNKMDSYSNTLAHPDMLPDNHICQIIEDKEENIWVMTANGIARYALLEDKFVQVAVGEKLLLGRSACLTDNGLLFGGTNQLYKYDYDTRRVALWSSFKTSVPFVIEAVFMLDSHQVVCFNRRQGAFKIDVKAQKMERIGHQHSLRYTDIEVDQKGRIWLSTYNNGIQCFTADNKLLRQYTVQNSALSSNLVLCITAYNQKIWIGTDGGGIDILDPETGEITVLKHISGDNHSLPVNTIYSLHGDEYQNIWAGGVRGEIINIRETEMKTYTDVMLNNPKGLTEKAVLCLYEDPKMDRIWIGTDGGGVNLFNPEDETFVHYPKTWGDKVVAITNFTEEELLLSLFSKGLYIFDKKTGEKKPFLYADTRLDSVIRYSGQSVNLYQDNASSVLVLGPVIYRYLIKEHKVVPVMNADDVAVKGMLCPILHTANHVYFHDSYHIYLLDSRQNTLSLVFTMPKGIRLLSVCGDEAGKFWIGSDHGLYTYDPQTSEWVQIEDSLFHYVSSVLFDSNQRLWIGAEQKLFNYLPREKRLIMWGKSDGISDNDYLTKARLLSRRQDIYLGGVKGLLHVNADYKMDIPESPEVRLISFELNGKNCMEQIRNGRLVIRQNKSHNLRIRVGAYGIDVLRPRVYHYQIGNFVVSGKDTELTIPSLSKGVYPVIVSCDIQNGKTIPCQLLVLEVLSPWYATWWFILCCIVCFVGMVSGVVWNLMRRKERKLQWLVKEHEQKINEDKVRLLININHELRTPLTLINAPLGRLLKKMEVNHENYTTLLHIYKQSRWMKYLIDMVLDIRKLEVGKIQLCYRSHSVHQFVEEVIENFSEEFQFQHVTIKYDCKDEIEEAVFDKEKCMIVLINLVMNALKHSPVDSTVTIRTQCTEGFIRFSVTDQGKGIDESEKGKLFIRFYQSRGEKGGSGIGLSYAKSLVELHHGRIGAYNNGGKGATFFFEIPVDLPVSEEESNGVKKNLLSGNEFTGYPVEVTDYSLQECTLLLVDDNVEMTEFFADDLKEFFKKIYVAHNGKEALEVMAEKPISIIVSDVMMPEMDGYELCHMVKQNVLYSHIPVILLTARSDKQSKEYGYKIGGDAYLTKPFNTEELMRAVRVLLYNREQIQKHFQHVGILPHPVKDTFSQGDEVFLSKLNKIVVDNIGNPSLDIPFLCKEIGMSRASLYNKLKAVTDMGANDYINKFRMEQAIKLIKNTELSITEISEQVGFATSRYFSTSFKQYTGMTPTQYKNKYHKQEEGTEND